MPDTVVSTSKMGHSVLRSDLRAWERRKTRRRVVSWCGFRPVIGAESFQSHHLALAPHEAGSEHEPTLLLIPQLPVI